MGLILLLVPAVGAQGLRMLPDGFDNGAVRATPLPGTPEARPARTLEMATLAATVGPGDFVLVSAQSNRFGPYPYRQDAALGSERFPYTLMVENASTFRLSDPRKHTTLGPFAYETGTAIAFDQSTLSLQRLPSQVCVTLAPRGRQSHEPMLALAPLTPATAQSLGQLRATLAMLYNRLSGELATRGIEGLPVIRDGNGFVHNETIKPSVRDRENARRRAESTAGLALERFQRECMPFKAVTVDNLTYAFPSVPQGTYILCALWRLRERDALTAAPAALEVWWTPCQVGTQEKLTLTLTPENACGWTGIFKFPKFD